MIDFKSYRRSAIRYWEWRRIFYNLALVPPAFIGFVVCGATSAAAGDASILSMEEILVQFIMSAIGANICYTFAYVFEFLFGGNAPESRWPRWGRTVAFASGMFIAIMLAFFGGVNIAKMQYGVNPRTDLIER